MSSIPLRRRVPRLAAALTAAASVLLVPVAAAHADAVINGPAVNAAFGAQAGDVAAAPDGSATIAWSGGVGNELWTRHVTSDGAVSTPVSLGAALRNAVPVLTAAPTGVTAVAWTAPVGSGRASLHLATLDPTGTPRHDTTLETTTSADAHFGSYAVGIDADGAVTVAWAGPGAAPGSYVVHATRVGPDGVAGPTLDLGPTAQDGPSTAANGMQVAETPDGTAWVGWLGPDYQVKVVRLVHGSIEASSATSVSGIGSESFRLASSPAGAVAAWLTHDPDAPGDPFATLVAGVRLPVHGALTGAGFTSGPFTYMSSGSGHVPQYDAAVGPDGTVALLYSDVSLSTVTGALRLDLIAPGQSGGSPVAVATEQAWRVQLAPSLGVRPDGTVLAAWVEADGGSTAQMVVRRIAPGGALGPALEAARIPLGSDGYAVQTIRTQLGGEGAMFGLGLWNSDQDGNTSWDLNTAYLDVTGPTLSVDVPDSVTVLKPVVLTASVSDPTGAAVTWDFGDGASATGASVTHVYAATGTYAVKASATDTHDNRTVVSRTLTVTDPEVPAGPPPAVVGSPSPTPQPTPTPHPTPQSAPASAALKVTAATRTGAKVTVSGTIAAKAAGTITVTYAQKAGRKTIEVKRTAKIAKGRWKVTLTLPKALTRGAAARGKGTVTASFAGTKTIKKATARKTVALAKAKKRK
ncbi:MAG TPA: PKD domain-containing protein [Baekduia sp.]|uniref:PKD domain-containing protein n=1 Tax=Baekduia sp. TaxID=2600305 RepID=UPI002D769D68|nr:PKD domain-containing protein [Baekduia sp.]HET6509341.1 PKD domain-containing protein [Baekduia sp.]